MEDRLREIEERNKRVESEKAWETSTTRIASIALITYICVSILLLLIGVPEFYLAALVPVLGYLLSTQSLPALKSWWIRRHNQ